MDCSNYGVPQWDTADRMRKALRSSGVSQQEIADYLGMSRNSVSAYINGRTNPSRATAIAWAVACGVSPDWLVGEATRKPPSQFGWE